jgi:alkaline phosphatase D
MLARVDMEPGTGEALAMDKWNAYEVCRDRMMRYLLERKPSNPIVITGDIHSNWVSDLKVDWKDEKATVVATEFTGTSISSSGDGIDEHANAQAWYRENPHLKMYNGRRGYVMITLGAEQCRADYRIVPYVTKAGAPVVTQSSWVVENNRRGVVKV